MAIPDMFEQCCESGSGIRCILTPGSGMGEKQGSGIWIRDEQSGSYFLELQKKPFLGLKYLNSLMRIHDPGWKNSDPGWKNWDPGSGMEKFRSGIRDGKKSDLG